MAFFRDTIGGQVAVQNAVNDQLAREAQAQKEQAMRQYLLGKQFGDDKMTGVATRDMNTGLIPNMMNKGLDLVLGSGRHNPDVERYGKEFMPQGEGLTEEQQQYNQNITRLKSMSDIDRIKEAAFKTYRQTYGDDIPEADLEEQFKKDYYDSQGRIKGREFLDEPIKDAYDKNEKQLRQEQVEARKAKLHEDPDAELRDHMKKLKIDGMSDFSGSHSNMNNENLKYHKALIDFYVKKRDWDKAQEIQQSYERNQQNIDKHWGDSGPKQYQSLFNRPSGGGGTGKAELLGLSFAGDDTDYSISLPRSQWNNTDAVANSLGKQYGQAVKEKYLQSIKDNQGPSQFDAGQKDRTDTGPDRRARLAARKLEEEKVLKDFNFNSKNRYNKAALNDSSNPYVAISGKQLIPKKDLKRMSLKEREDVAKGGGISIDELDAMLAEL